MKRDALAVALLIGLAVPAWADYLDGMVAYVLGEYATALQEFKPLADKGHAKAQAGLGLMYELGRGVPQDYAEAVKWYHKAAEQGNAGGQNGLGWMYYHGQGVPQDYAEAVKWTRKAAEQGVARAQHLLGFMYREGQGVPQDYVQAHMWFNLAASRSSLGKHRDESVKNRDFAATKLTPTQIAEAEKLAREWKPKRE